MLIERSRDEQDSRTAGQQDSRTAGQQDSRTAGQQDSRTAGQFKKSNVKLRHFLEQKALFIVASVFIMFLQTISLKAQTPVWMLGYEGLEFNSSSASQVLFNSFGIGGANLSGNRGFNAAIGASDDVLFFVRDGEVHFPNDDLLGEINTTYYYPNPVFGQPRLTGTYGLRGTPEILIVPVPGRCLQYYIIGGNNTLLDDTYGAASSGTDPGLFYTAVNMSAQDPITNNYGVFWNVATQQNLGATNTLATIIPPVGYSDWTNFNVHTSDLHLAVTGLRTDNTRFLFISRGGHLYKSLVTASGISDAQEIPMTNGSQSGTSLNEMEVYEDYTNPNTEYRLAFTRSNADELVVTTVNHAGTNTSNTVVLNGVFRPTGSSFSNPIRGLEFSPDGNYLYVNVTNGNYLRCYDSNTLNNIQLPVITQSILSSYATSMIEGGVDGNLYIVNIDGVNVGKISNPNNPSSTTFTPNSFTLLYPGSVGAVNNQSDFSILNNVIQLSVLPDQVDGELYSNNFNSIKRSCCNFIATFDQESYTVTSTETWNSNSNPISNGNNVIKIKNNLTINANQTLNLSDLTIEFGSEGKIIIEPGATLNIFGCTLTGSSFCEVMWQGIVVLGDIPNNLQGSLNMEDGFFPQQRNCIIENAIQAITTGLLYGNGDIPNEFDGGFIDIENVYFINNYEGIEYASHPVLGNTSSIRNCNFSSNVNMWYPYYRQTANNFIHTIGVSSNNISFYGFDNYFDRANIAFNLQNCTEMIIKNCDIKNCSMGVWSNTSGFNGKISQCDISINDFYNTHTCIRIENGNDDAISSNEFNKSNGLQNDNYYGVYLDNTSNFSITDNLFNYNKYGVYVINSGRRGGVINKQSIGNVFTGCWRGIHTYLDNSGLQISCNRFINDIYFNALNPNQFSSAWFINGDLANQGETATIGVNNEFLSIGNRKDIASIKDNTSNSCDAGFNFCYYSTLGFFNGNPTINTSYPFAYPSIETSLPSICSRQNLMSLAGNDPGLAQEIIANEQNELQKRVWTNELLRWYVVNEENDSLVAFLQSSTELSDQEQLFFRYLFNNQYSNANSTLSELATNNEINAQQFVSLNAITLFVAQNNISIQAIDSTSIATITSIAATDTRISAQARTMLSQILDTIQNLKIVTDTLNARVANFDNDEALFNLSPNPAFNQTTIHFNIQISEDLYLEIIDINGRVVEVVRDLDKSEQLINFVNYKSGIYLVVLRNNNDFIESQKIVITDQ